MKLSVIFKEKPEYWGLRGDPYFWDYLCELAENMDIISPDELEKWIRDEHMRLSGEFMTDVSIVRVEKFAHGGMSSGGISGEWWTETGIPLLKSRLRNLSFAHFRIEKLQPFCVIGFEKVFDNKTAYAEIPKFWDEIYRKYTSAFAGKSSDNPYDRAIIENRIGEYGVCIDDMDGGRFRYLIAGRYAGGAVPDGMTVFEFSEGEWAIFDCFGKIPEALQSLNTRIWEEWMPQNPDYKLRIPASIEWYDTNGDMNDAKYHSAIWLPVKRK